MRWFITEEDVILTQLYIHRNPSTIYCTINETRRFLHQPRRFVFDSPIKVQQCNGQLETLRYDTNWHCQE
jgi:hypothetical protein